MPKFTTHHEYFDRSKQLRAKGWRNMAFAIIMTAVAAVLHSMVEDFGSDPISISFAICTIVAGFLWLDVRSRFSHAGKLRKLSIDMAGRAPPQAKAGGKNARFRG